ncbi:MAG: amylo-alpha-1,6-glucosidase [Chloroflexota bacterium]
MTIRLGRDICSNEAEASKREWLVTNGIGGFASGTIAGMSTRHYHGLLVGALTPPLGRTVLVTRLDETVTYNGVRHEIFSNRWDARITVPRGYRYAERFELRGTTPVWQYAIADALVEKSIWMQPGANTTYVRYRVLRAGGTLSFSIKALVNYRNFHGGTYANNWQMQLQPVDGGMKVEAFEGAVPFYVLSDNAQTELHHEWYRSYYLSTEAYRGLSTHDDNLYVGAFTVDVEPGAAFTMVATTEANAPLDADTAYELRREHETNLLAQSKLTDESAEIQQLVLAADQFIVDRNVEGIQGKSVIAGYHWFGDWGRDTMISLPGLTLSTGRYEVAGGILRTFARYVDMGMLPNRFPDSSETPEYNTVDATLWYFEAIRAYYAATQDEQLLADLYPVLQDIIDWHRRGTRYNIHMDEADGLIYAGERGVQLTWMDAKVGDWVVTPRTGKPIEVNALWYNALLFMADVAILQKDTDSQKAYITQAEQVKASFARYWNADADYCYDVLDGPDGDDLSLRPNQLFAVSLHHSPLSAEQQKAVVDVCARQLLTSHGLRSLASNHPDYIGTYGGNNVKRDAAYHQGTVWGWLIGPFVEAHLRVYGDKAAARSFLEPLIVDQIAAGCVGSLSEIFDGNAPFEPRGAVAQAWSIAEVLRTYLLTRD